MVLICTGDSLCHRWQLWGQWGWKQTLSVTTLGLSMGDNSMTFRWQLFCVLCVQRKSALLHISRVHSCHCVWAHLHCGMPGSPCIQVRELSFFTRSVCDCRSPIFLVPHRQNNLAPPSLTPEKFWPPPFALWKKNCPPPQTTPKKIWPTLTNRRPPSR